MIPPQPERFSDPAQRSAVIAGVADVYRRGVDTIVVWQGATQGRVDVYGDVPAALAAQGGDLGEGALVLSAVGSEARFEPATGRFVHVIGTVAPDDLVAVARALRSTDGTGLVYLD